MRCTSSCHLCGDHAIPIFQSCQSLVRAVPAKPPCPHSYIYRSQILGAGKTFVPSVLKMLRSGRRVLGLGLGQGSSAGGGGRGAFAINRLYHERVVDHYNNPRNVGSFDKNDPTVGTGLVGAPACGDVMKLQIKIDDQSGKIVDACFKTFGCGSAIASSSVVTEWVKGKPMEEVLSIKNTEIAKHLSLPPVKLHCSMLAEDAIKAAVKDYEAKRAKLGANAEASTMERAAHA